MTILNSLIWTLACERHDRRSDDRSFPWTVAWFWAYCRKAVNRPGRKISFRAGLH